MKTEFIKNILFIISVIILGWILISTLQVSLRIGTPQDWNFWEVFLKIMEWRMAL